MTGGVLYLTFLQPVCALLNVGKNVGLRNVVWGVGTG